MNRPNQTLQRTRKDRAAELKRNKQDKIVLPLFYRQALSCDVRNRRKKSIHSLRPGRTQGTSGPFGKKTIAVTNACNRQPTLGSGGQLGSEALRWAWAIAGQLGSRLRRGDGSPKILALVQ